MEPLAHTPTLDVEQLSLGDLRALQEKVDQAIDRQQEERQRQALDSIAQLVEEVGLPPAMVMKRITGKSRRSGGKLPPKYRDPENTQHVWAGRGKRPKWLEAKLAAGAKIEDFAIAVTPEIPHASTRVTAP